MKVIRHDCDGSSGKVWEAKAWDEPCAPRVTVEYRKRTVVHETPEVVVNWSCCGSVDYRHAGAFADLMREAMSVAAAWQDEMDHAREAGGC